MCNVHRLFHILGGGACSCNGAVRLKLHLTSRQYQDDTRFARMFRRAVLSCKSKEFRAMLRTGQLSYQSKLLPQGTCSFCARTCRIVPPPSEDRQGAAACAVGSTPAAMCTQPEPKIGRCPSARSSSFIPKDNALIPATFFYLCR